MSAQLTATVFESVPNGEDTQIENIVASTKALLQRRYAGQSPMLRGVHPKDHGCVLATFAVEDQLNADLAVGLFAQPGAKYEAVLRYSNAANLVTPDSSVDKGVNIHGSRGMAIKVMGINGDSLLPSHGAPTQDFLLVNHPVFAFANVSDYEFLNDALLADPTEKNLSPFSNKLKASGDPKAIARETRTKEIIGQIRIGKPQPFQVPPATPVQNAYFSAAPFLFGADRVAKFSVVPTSPDDTPGQPNVLDPNYLRNGLIGRLAPDTKTNQPGNKPIVLKFNVQVRTLTDLQSADGGIETQIENACTEWTQPFQTVATITIEPQDFDTLERRALCERLFFTPWHCLPEHRPIGGINRLRRAVYEASAQMRNLPKEPVGFR